MMHNTTAWFDDGWEHGPDAVLRCNWLPAFHDLGLVYGIMAPVWGGFLGVQMSPIDVIQRPAVWLRAISDLRATHSCGPNFIYDLSARRVGAGGLRRPRPQRVARRAHRGGARTRRDDGALRATLASVGSTPAPSRPVRTPIRRGRPRWWR